LTQEEVENLNTGFVTIDQWLLLRKYELIFPKIYKNRDGNSNWQKHTIFKRSVVSNLKSDSIYSK
jgi:hypothetical protein